MDTQQMIELAKGFQEWIVDNDNERFRLDVIDLADIPQAGLYISQGTTPELGEFIANAPRTILALADEVARLQARCVELEQQATKDIASFEPAEWTRSEVGALGFLLSKIPQNNDWEPTPLNSKSLKLLVKYCQQLEARCAELERNSAALDGWRSVEDEMPPAQTWALVEIKTYGTDIRIAFWSGSAWLDDNDELLGSGSESDGVTHWQPLPPAPQPSPNQP